MKIGSEETRVIVITLHNQQSNHVLYLVGAASSGIASGTGKRMLVATQQDFFGLNKLVLNVPKATDSEIDVFEWRSIGGSRCRRRRQKEASRSDDGSCQSIRASLKQGSPRSCCCWKVVRDNGCHGSQPQGSEDRERPHGGLRLIVCGFHRRLTES
jgi:hypothetical protein